MLIQKEEIVLSAFYKISFYKIISFLQNQNDHFLKEVNFLRREVKEKAIVIKKLIGNCRQNINCNISNNRNPFSTDDKSLKRIKDSNGVNSISVPINPETISQKTLNLSGSVISTPPNTLKANKTNPNKVNPFIAVRPRRGDDFSKTSNQDDNEHKKSNSHSDKNIGKDQGKNKGV